MNDAQITDLTVAAIAIYVAVLLVYLIVAFTAKGSLFYTGPTRFWTLPRIIKEKGIAPGHLRWAQVTLKTAPFNGIQSLRCILQAGIYYSASCITIAFFVIFLSAGNSRAQLLYLTMGCVAICASVCFIQHMRFCYHLGFLVMFQQPKETPPTTSGGQAASAAPLQGAVPPSGFTHANHETDIHLGIFGGLAARGKFNKAVALHVVGDRALPPSALVSSSSHTCDVRPNTSVHDDNVSPTVTPSTTDLRFPVIVEDRVSADMLRHIEAENSLDMNKHTARVAYVTQRHAFNFALGMRLMLFLIPVALGAFGDELMIATTFTLLPIMWYMDRLS